MILCIEKPCLIMIDYDKDLCRQHNEAGEMGQDSIHGS